MSKDEFLREQYLTLREEIRASKVRSFSLVVIGTLLVPALSFAADKYGSLFAGASVPFVVLVVMLAFLVEQNGIIRAGRYIRERIEPSIEGVTGWESWLEKDHHLRTVDKLFFGSFMLIFLIFYAVGMRVAWEALAVQWPDNWIYAAGGYLVGGVWFIYVLFRHWHSCTSTTE
jgi:hypothetical protein